MALRSRGEVNANPSSSGPFDVSFGPGSSSTPTLGGTFNGGQGSDTLTFRVLESATVGDDSARIGVFDGQDQQIDELVFTSAETTETLSNGLTLRLSSGTLVQDESFQIAVESGVVDSNKAFDEDPNFEAGNAVTSGAFTLNDVQIDVASNDSINSILDAINSSAAGVFASFDDATESVILEEATPGGGVVLGEDTSGFLDAVKLTGATPSAGPSSDLLRSLSSVGVRAGISTGTFSINGVQLSVDADVDSLSDVLGRISSSAAGVTARFDSAQDKVVLTSRTRGEDLVLDDETSGFFAGVGIAAGTTAPGLLADSADQDALLSQVSLLAGISDGVFRVNGVELTVDTQADTLNDVLGRINASATGVTASFDSGQNRVVLTSNTPGEDLVLEDRASGLFSALGITPGRTAPALLADSADRETALSQVTELSGILDGTLRVNGVEIAVDTQVDSLRDVLDRISSSEAGVTASFDSARNKVVLSSDTPGGPLALEDESSGFFSALGITADTPVDGLLGNTADRDTVLSQVSELAGIFDGTLRVNGVEIAVDTQVDSLNDILGRISSSAAGVTATFDAAQNKVVLTSDTLDQDLALDDETSGFFGAIGIATGTTAPALLADTNAQDILLSQASELSEISSGTFRVNGIELSVDRQADTLNDVLSQISSSEAGVTASFDSELNKVVLTSNTLGESLVLDDETSGFFSAIGITPGTKTPALLANTADKNAVLSQVSELAGIFDGTLRVNGVEVAVDTQTDSLSDVLRRISSSDAGVRASFDSARNKVVLTSRTEGQDLVLDDETSGFFSALGITPGTTKGGLLDDTADRDALLSEVSVLSGISAGTFRVNGVELEVDTQTDSLSDVLGRISSSAAGVTASFDSARNRVVLKSRTPGEDIVLEDGSSDFFAGVGITAGTIEGADAPSDGGRRSGSTRPVESPPAVRAELQDLESALQRLSLIAFEPEAEGEGTKAITGLRQAITSAFGQPGRDTSVAGRLRSSLGIGVSFADAKRFELRIDSELLSRAITKNADELERFLLADADDDENGGGLLTALDRALETIGNDLVKGLDPEEALGLILDLQA